MAAPASRPWRAGLACLAAGVLLASLGRVATRSPAVPEAPPQECVADGPGYDEESGAHQLAGLGPLVATYAVATRCEGPVQVLDATGEPLAGARVEAGPSLAVTDADGLAPWPDRPCGRQVLAVRVGELEYGGLRVEVTDHSPVRVQLPALAQATVSFVDKEGKVLDAAIEPTAYLADLEERGPGRWWLRGPAGSVPLTVQAPDRSPTRFTVSLDGGHHQLFFPADREVQVEATCDASGCPPLQCAGTDCLELEPGRFACWCPGLSARLRAGGAVLEVPDGASQVHADLRAATRALQARWTGSLPCEAVLQWGRSSSGELCAADGTIETQVRPGAYRLRIRGAKGDEAQLPVSVAEAPVDLGPIAPGGQAPIPPREATVLASAPAGESGAWGSGAWDSGAWDSGAWDSGAWDSGAWDDQVPVNDDDH